MDKIQIKGLEIYAYHGVYPEETKLGQKFVLDMELRFNSRPAGRADDLTQTINYGKVTRFADAFLKEHTYYLLEAALEHLAEALLLEFGLLESVKLSLDKPWAPIALPLETVSLEIERGWHTAYISFGSNMGDRRGHIDRAIEALRSERCNKVTKVSTIIETEPYGLTEQAPFLNGALELKTLLSPEELLDQLQQIELAEGRVRTIHWGPRTLDLDILYYDQEIIQEQDLVVPHYDMANRLFVLKPLAEIAPYTEHPVEHTNTLQLLKRLEQTADR